MGGSAQALVSARAFSLAGNGGKVMSVTRVQDDVFEDLGFDAEEAANLKIRADLMLDLRQYIQDRDWTQAEAAALLW